MFRCVLLTVLATVVMAIPFNKQLDSQWELFKQVHNKRYRIFEEGVGRINFEQNVERINKHNLEYDMGIHTYTLGLNVYSDMSNTDFNQLKGLAKNSNGLRSSFHTLPGDLPDTVDWRDKGIVPPVRYQGQMGVEWPYTAVASLEGIWALVHGQGPLLSEQQLLDCCSNGDPGSFLNPFQCIRKTGGIDKKACYPGDASRASACDFKKSCIGATVKDVVYIPPGDELALQTAVATAGPIAAAIDASQFSFQLYSGGVYDEPNCSNTTLDHSVLIVGYGTRNGKAYWLVQNSWGKSWGEEGYILMSRNKHNQCGIATDDSYPTV